jgi:hypothetical protein
MFEQPCRLLFDQLGNHGAEDGSHRVETLVGGADVVQAVIVQQDLLDDKDGNRLAEFRACLHDAQAKRDDFGCEEKVDHFGGVVLDESADNTQRREAEIFERA